MAFTLEKIVPWGRSFAEYVDMFCLSEADQAKRILGCGDGPASFNAELNRRGGRVVSVDPIYRFAADQIKERIDATSAEILKQAEANKDEFVWDRIRSVAHLGEIRHRAMEEFLVDYETRRDDDRYLNAELPALPFPAKEFDLALCSHLLFLYSEQLSLDFHLQAIKELCRVADEVRIFPLLELGAKKSRHLDNVIATLEKSGFACAIVPVPYEFQKGGNRMMTVRSPLVRDPRIVQD